MKIINKSIRIIDYENETIKPILTPVAFDEYVSDLVNHILENESVRKYKTRSSSTEVINCILKINSSQDEESIIRQMDTIAKRLLLKEKEAQNKINRTNTTVQKGSLIQALLTIESTNEFAYLLAKVEHSEWVDDADFSFKTGFSKNKKSLWKSCLFDLSDVSSEVFYSKIFSDTKALYWSDGFLELDEINSDESNTIAAFKAIEKVLNQSFRGSSSPDHTLLRNGFLVYLKNNDYIDYPKMVSNLLDSYKPQDEKINEDKIIKIKEKLLEQPALCGFDNQFNVVNSAINGRIRQIYHVNDGIDLRVNGAIENILEKIIAVEENGARYIKIRTTDNSTFSKFNSNGL